jgi:uncharacterized protein (DUF58 family)
VAIGAATDAVLGKRRLEGTGAASSPFLKWFKGRPSKFSLDVKERGQIASLLKVSLDLPEGLTAPEEVVTLGLSETHAEFGCLPERRGRYEVTRCYLRAASPLRLWHIRAAKEIKTEIRVFPDLEREPGGKLLLMKKMGGLRTQRAIGRGTRI